jgi:hypothetical protein
MMNLQGGKAGTRHKAPRPSRGLPRRTCPLKQVRAGVVLPAARRPRGPLSTTCAWGGWGSPSRWPSRSLVWVGGRFSPCRCFRLRRRTDRRHRTRAPTRPLQAASRASPGPLPFEDLFAANRSRHLPRCRAATFHERRKSRLKDAPREPRFRRRPPGAILTSIPVLIISPLTLVPYGTKFSD